MEVFGDLVHFWVQICPKIWLSRYTHTHTHTHTCVYIYIYIYTYIHTYIHIYSISDILFAKCVQTHEEFVVVFKMLLVHTCIHISDMRTEHLNKP